ncbi:MAG TPA: hypothetical protein VJZ71_14595 [Phycisphaerae bacterium]|nr:hypothetical protein [Phycisphaerae bacterium]
MSALAFFVMTVLSTAQPPQEATPPSTIEQIKNTCRQQAAAHKSLAANITISTDLFASNAQIRSHATGTYEHLRSKGRLLFRVDLKNAVTQTAAGRTAVVDQTIQTVSDGKYAYTISTTAGQPPSATRAQPMPSQTVLADEAFFASLERDFNFRILPDANIESHEVWVLETVPKTRAPGRPAKTIYYLTKESGIRIRSTGHDATGKRIQLTELTDIKLDPPLKPERFVFKPPPGVPVVDLSESK